jgi:hypothetical protein
MPRGPPQALTQYGISRKSRACFAPIENGLFGWSSLGTPLNSQASLTRNKGLAMATLTLTKSSRLQERIRAAIPGLQLAPTVTLGIFAMDPDAAVEQAAGRLRADLDVLRRLLSILASLRAATGQANAACGITQLLAERAAAQEEVTLISKLIPEGSPPEEFDGLYRPARPHRLLRHVGEIEQEVRAMRARYEHADERETTIAAPLLDDAAAERLRSRVVACRRRLNSTVVIEINDEALSYCSSRSRGYVRI